MNVTALAFIMGLSAIIFAAPARMKWHVAFVLQLLFAFVTGWTAFSMLINDIGTLDIPFFYLREKQIRLVVDPLSSYFILVIF